ncbi:hypothetical protein BGW80DRAFT_1247123 [Lactifluus volemus]|nr:hypothetical protein BGW80DRAFT_1247123 [Lactifluus volemus]
MPLLATQALSSVLNTIGPSTVINYLQFACGEGIGPLQDADLDPLVGLEHVAQLVKTETADCAPPPVDSSKPASDKVVESFSQNLEALSVEEQVRNSQSGSVRGEGFPVEKENPAELLSPESDDRSSLMDETGSDLSFSYGAVSDKIGEACVCWLARWGADMLACEQQAAGAPKQATSSTSISTPSIGRQSALSGWEPFNSDVVPTPLPKVPFIWRRGGLTAIWVRALISSNLLFVRGEKERYELAKAVVELRRSAGVLEDEEVEWVKMFSEGIYYANMSFEDLVQVSHDRSPTTGRPYVPERVIQAAHWTQSMLRYRIVGLPPSSPPSSPTGTSRHKALGIAVSQKDIKEALSHPGSDEEDRVYWTVPGPSSMRMGDGGGVENATMDELFGLSSVSPKNRTPGRSSMSVSNFFGLETDRCSATECASGMDSARWVPYPPYRFAVEFWDVDSLREKSHLYSQTIWYAGSLFNVFVQMFRKKSQGPQLGVYLHRQSSVDPIPPFSVPYGTEPPLDDKSNNPRTPPSPSPLTHLSTFTTQYSPSGLPIIPSPRSTTPVHGSPSSSSHSGSTLPATGPPVIPSQPYRDPRAQVSAYFAISCISATGSSATQFTSNPDDFSISQSWGWRSSSLRTQVCGDDDKLADPSSVPPSSADVSSMRVTVIVGIV